MENLRASSATVAVAVAGQAVQGGTATIEHDNLVQAVQDAMWQPVYRPSAELCRQGGDHDGMTRTNSGAVVNVGLPY